MKCSPVRHRRRPRERGLYPHRLARVFQHPLFGAVAATLAGKKEPEGLSFSLTVGRVDEILGRCPTSSPG